MRVMAIVKASPESEREERDPELGPKMDAFNRQLVEAGVMLGGDGLHPTSRGVRLQFDGGRPTVSDGPFAETKELIAGYWILQVRTFDEAVEWMKHAPFSVGQLELRQMHSDEDFDVTTDAERRAREPLGQR